MNHNMNLECEVCKNKVRLKVYAGYVDKNSFSFACPECTVTISGYLIWNESLEEGFIKEFVCNNAIIPVETSPETSDVSHVLQIATEFYTDKIKAWKAKDPTSFLSPYMLDDSPFEIKQRKVNIIQHTTDNFKNDFKIAMRLWELYENENYKYLNRQLVKNEFVEPVTMGEVLKVHYPSKMMDVLYKPFAAILVESDYRSQTRDLRKILQQIKNNNLEEVIELKKDLENILDYANLDLIHLLKNFSNYYELIWPIILSNIIKSDDIDKEKEKKGILTTSFENLKHYYVEAFEVLCSLLPIYLGLQNIYIRGNRNSFEQNIKRKFSKIDTIIDYNVTVQKNGNKLKYFEEENTFKDIVDWEKFLSSDIRNSIGHHSYDYESDKQLIAFKDRKKINEMYLIEFSDMLLSTFFATFAGLEVLTFLKDIER